MPEPPDNPRDAYDVLMWICVVLLTGIVAVYLHTNHRLAKQDELHRAERAQDSDRRAELWAAQRELSEKWATTAAGVTAFLEGFKETTLAALKRLDP